MRAVIDWLESAPSFAVALVTVTILSITLAGVINFANAKLTSVQNDDVEIANRLCCTAGGVLAYDEGGARCYNGVDVQWSRGVKQYNSVDALVLRLNDFGRACTDVAKPPPAEKSPADNMLPRGGKCERAGGGWICTWQQNSRGRQL